MTSNDVATAGQVESLLGRPPAPVMMKQTDRLDAGCVTVLAHSPIAGVGYQDAYGDRRATFAGGAAGFVDVLSPTRISFSLPPAEAVPAVDGGISFVFLLPGVSETLRLNATVVAQDGPRTVAQVREVYVHCARAVGRAQLWQRPAPTRRASTPDLLSAEPLYAPAVREFLEAAPFLVVTSGDPAGGSDTSPRGDRPGFARILGGRTLAVPDRKGNQRADTFHNLVQDQRIALAALVPGRREVLHLRGTATITTDQALLDTMALRGMSPHAALLIDVAEADLTDSDAVRGSRLWDPAVHVDRAVVPDLNILAAEHLAANPANRAGWLIRLAAALLKRFPGLTRRLMARTFSSVLEKEGYGTAESRRPGTPAQRLRISAVRQETPTAVTVVMHDAADPARPMIFQPGQFFTFTAKIDGRTVRRAYSASSAPGSPELEITVKRIDGGLFSAFVHEQLRPGDHLEVRGPSGALFEPVAGEGEVVMVAAGSGITPMMSIIRSQLARTDPGRLILLYGNRGEDGIIFAAELARLRREHPGRLDVTHQLSRPGPAWSGPAGRITAESLTQWLAAVRPSPTARYHLCGPGPIMDTAHAALIEAGVEADRIRQESYLSAADDSAPGPAHRMTVTEFGAVTVAGGDTLLDAGLAEGLPMPYSCTVGTCGECVVKLLGGQVVMSEPNSLTPEQRTAGYVLTCVGRPSSDVTIDIADL